MQFYYPHSHCAISQVAAHLEEIQCFNNTPKVQEDWSLVLDEVKQQMSYAGIRISNSKLVDFFRGRNESVFSELRESEHYGRFRTETDDFVEELFGLKPAASASHSDIKSGETRGHCQENPRNADCKTRGRRLHPGHKKGTSSIP